MPDDKPEMLNAEPVRLTELIVTEALPLFERDAFCVCVVCRVVLGKVMEVGDACREAEAACPVPCTATLKGEFGASLVMVSVALAVVVEEAVKLTVKFMLAPGASWNGTAIELREKPEPVRLMPVTFELALPVLEI